MNSSSAALKVLGIAMVLAISVVGVVVTTSALSLSEIVRAQGGAPWQFGAARKPATFLLALTYLDALFLLVRPSTEEPVTSAHARAPKPASGPRARGAVVERLGLLVACALGVAVFFGGWQLPVVGAARSLELQLVAALVFVVKTWTLVAVLRGAARPSLRRGRAATHARSCFAVCSCSVRRCRWRWPARVDWHQ